MKIHCFDNAIIVPTVQNIVGYSAGLYLSTGEYVKFSGKRFYGTCEYEYEQSILDSNNLEIVEDNRAVLYFGYTRNHWGHFLIDEVQKMWPIVLDKDRYDGVAIYTPDVLSPNKFVYSILEYLGIPENKIIQVKKITRFSKVYYAEMPYVVGQEMKDEFFQVFREISLPSNAIWDNSSRFEDKLYLSRTKLNGGKSWEFGEKRIEAILRKNGFAILFPEALPVKTQIHYYRNAKLIVTTNGTLAHNILFAREDTEIIILNRFYEPEGNIHQNLIGKRFKQQVVNSTSKYATHATSIILQNRKLRECFETLEIEMPNKLESFLSDVIEYSKFTLILMLKKIYNGIQRLIKKV